MQLNGKEQPTFIISITIKSDILTRKWTLLNQQRNPRNLRQLKLKLNKLRHQYVQSTLETKENLKSTQLETTLLNTRLLQPSHLESELELQHSQHPNTNRCLTTLFRLQVGPAPHVWVVKIFASLNSLTEVVLQLFKLLLIVQCQTLHKFPTQLLEQVLKLRVS